MVGDTGGNDLAQFGNATTASMFSTSVATTGFDTAKRYAFRPFTPTLPTALGAF